MDIESLIKRLNEKRPDPAWADSAEVEGYAICCIQVGLELKEAGLIESVPEFMIQCGYAEDSAYVMPGIYIPSE